MKWRRLQYSLKTAISLSVKADTYKVFSL